MSSPTHTSNPDHSGPAFPKPIPHYATAEDTGGDCGADGMSLRDYFAAKAMQVVMDTWARNTPAEDDAFNDVYQAKIAAVAYNFADAMLAARKAGG